MLGQAFVNGLMGSMVIILLASGLSLIFGIMHIINFAHGEFFMLGGVGVWLLFSERLIPRIGGSDIWRYGVAIILSMIAVALLGVIVERYIYRRSRGDVSASIITSFGIILILQASALAGLGIRDKVVSSPFTGMINFAGTSLPQERMAVIIVGAVLIGLLHLFIQRTKLGKTIRAVAQDADAASLLGVNTGLILSLTMGIGCALAAAGGALIAPVFVVNPYMGVEPIMKAFAVIILGGMGSLPGAIIGGFIIGLTESFVATYIGAHVALIVVFSIVIILLLVRPTGIFGHAP